MAQKKGHHIGWQKNLEPDNNEVEYVKIGNTQSPDLQQRCQCNYGKKSGLFNR